MLNCQSEPRLELLAIPQLRACKQGDKHCLADRYRKKRVRCISKH
jgi:hypothetical protein